MANQRAEGKKLIGAQASPELWAAVDEWLAQNPGKSVSDFLLSACVEKLQKDQIPIDPREALRDRRIRYPTLQPSHYTSSSADEQVAADLARALRAAGRSKKKK